MERSIIKCKRCSVLKLRILKKKVGKEKIWVDEDGFAWNGKTCPNCHKEVVRLRIRDRRAQK